ncbi:hypothetical protein LCGC14_1801750 [marine sediment metagenome]|uniref:Uncharacterized protein n=1 Tax=marine sediment metagenome TaxID=412755 RepID=A0A0F9JP30_9ZZZZ
MLAAEQKRIEGVGFKTTARIKRKINAKAAARKRTVSDWLHLHFAELFAKKVKQPPAPNGREDLFA